MPLDSWYNFPPSHLYFLMDASCENLSLKTQIFVHFVTIAWSSSYAVRAEILMVGYDQVGDVDLPAVIVQDRCCVAML